MSRYESWRPFNRFYFTLRKKGMVIKRSFSGKWHAKGSRVGFRNFLQNLKGRIGKETGAPTRPVIAQEQWEALGWCSLQRLYLNIYPSYYLDEFRSENQCFHLSYVQSVRQYGFKTWGSRDDGQKEFLCRTFGPSQTIFWAYRSSGIVKMKLCGSWGPGLVPLEDQ